ncbi:MAG TPA: hypothetical protein DCY64_18925 [Hydrogenophaga sp.]|uniref:NAD(P)-binding protein n=1 Tax=Hydrogenophaga sp. TaxID=1904254 RepID=UPI000A3E637A|nr:hypothetical protein [Hydrogenophaga sp.]HBU20349.1 hypothetical protein [Hydrogenophaga sp.]
MHHHTIETDYLVVGAGAMGMAFVDTLIDQSDATVLMVDPHPQPGGHWNDAYPFVRLHQPSAWYGVASTPVDEAVPDPSGYGRGATGAAVLAYFARLMRERFLPTGRVRWFPSHQYRQGDDGSHRIVCLATGAEQVVKVRRKRVDATHARTEVPSVRRPAYGLADASRLASCRSFSGPMRTTRWSDRARPAWTPVSGCWTAGYRRRASAGSCPATPGCRTAPTCCRGRSTSS